MKVLTGRRIKNALLAGIAWFSHFRKKVDHMNVFPVPDGDTGKNMYHALVAAQKEITGASGRSAAEVAWAAARGSMMGGRGCSGMILSGFFAGFAEGVGERRSLTAEDLARAFQIGCMRARERIDHPVEGTILTVGEAAAQHAWEASKRSSNLTEVIVAAWKGAQQALQETPRHLPVLNQHHVVDAGGMGLVYFLEGMVRFNFRQSLSAESAQEQLQNLSGSKPKMAPAKISEYKFCTEFIISQPGLTRAALHALLAPMSEELMIGTAEPGIYKVHLHAKNPETVLQRVARLGTLQWKKIDDMEEQHRHAFQDPGDGEKAEQGRTRV